MAGHGVCGIHHYLERADSTQRNQHAQEAPVIREGVTDLHSARNIGPREAVYQVALRERSHIAQAGVLAHRTRLGAAQLHAVVGSRVVARGHHHARHVQCARCVVQPIRRTQADAHDVHTARSESVCHRGREPGARVPHVVTDGHMCLTIRDHHGIGKGGADSPGHVLGEILTHDAADVVRLNKATEVGVGHRQSLASYRSR